jgi:hypothetical protein
MLEIVPMAVLKFVAGRVALAQAVAVAEAPGAVLADVFEPQAASKVRQIDRKSAPVSAALPV